MTKAAITAIGGFLPDNIVTNFDLEKIIDTTDEWITSRTGIKQRHIEKDPKKLLLICACKPLMNYAKNEASRPGK